MNAQKRNRLINGRYLRDRLGAVMVSAVLAGQAGAQQTSTEDLKRSIESLSDGILTLQSEIQSLKSILAGQLAPPSGVNVLVDVSLYPVRGKPDAKLTLIEVSDYQ
jgi:hypothetical protein